MRKQLSLLIVGLLLLSSVATAFHHHEGTADHADCPICTVSHHQQATGSTPVVVSLILTYTTATWFLPEFAIITATAYTPANNRAPPV